MQLPAPPGSVETAKLAPILFRYFKPSPAALLSMEAVLLRHRGNKQAHVSVSSAFTLRPTLRIDRFPEVNNVLVNFLRRVYAVEDGPRGVAPGNRYRTILPRAVFFAGRMRALHFQIERFTIPEGLRSLVYCLEREETA